MASPFQFSSFSLWWWCIALFDVEDPGGSFVGTPWPEIGDARTSSGRFDDSLSDLQIPDFGFSSFPGAWPGAKNEIPGKLW